MICPNCGENNPSDALFCGGCGQKLEESITPVQPVSPAAAPRATKKGNPLVAIIGAVFIMGIGAVIFMQLGDTPEESDAIGMLENSFTGGYSGVQIQDTMDKAMVLYDVERNNENYLTCGALLTALRFETEEDEMDILKEMLDRYESGKKSSFEDGAREAARALTH